MNKESISKEAINKSGFCNLTFCAKLKESLDTNLFLVKSESKGTRNLAIL